MDNALEGGVCTAPAVPHRVWSPLPAGGSMVRQVIRVPVAAEGSRHAPPRIPTQRHPTDLGPVSHVHDPHGGSGRSSLASLGLHRVPSLLFEMDLGGEGAEAPLRPEDEGGLAVSRGHIALQPPPPRASE